MVGGPTLEAVLARHPYLGAEQAEMVRRLTAGGERIVAVAALPGTGKTTALAAAREAWEAAGYPVIGVATARTASGELADIGVPATSIAALLDPRRAAGRAGTSRCPRHRDRHGRGVDHLDARCRGARRAGRSAARESWWRSATRARSAPSARRPLRAPDPHGSSRRC